MPAAATKLETPILVAAKSEHPFTNWQQGTFDYNFSKLANSPFGIFVRNFCKEPVLPAKLRGAVISFPTAQELPAAITAIPNHLIEPEKIPKELLINLGIRSAQSDIAADVTEQEIQALKLKFQKICKLTDFNAGSRAPKIERTSVRVWLDTETGAIILRRKQHEGGHRGERVPIEKIDQTKRETLSVFADLPSFTRAFNYIQKNYATGSAEMQQLATLNSQLLPYLRFWPKLSVAHQDQAVSISHQIASVATAEGSEHHIHPNLIAIDEIAQKLAGLRDARNRPNPAGHALAAEAILTRADIRSSEMEAIQGYYYHDYLAATRTLQNADLALFSIVENLGRNENRKRFDVLCSQLQGNSNPRDIDSRIEALVSIELGLTKENLAVLNVMPYKLLHDLAEAERKNLAGAIAKGSKEEYLKHIKVLRDACNLIILQRRVDDVLLESGQADPIDANVQTAAQGAQKILKTIIDRKSCFESSGDLEHESLTKMQQLLKTIADTCEKDGIIPRTQLNFIRKELKKIRLPLETWQTRFGKHLQFN